MLRALGRDESVSAAVAGLVAVLVGFTSSIVIVFQAAAALGATPAQTTSWVWAAAVGTGLVSVGLSLRYRQPLLAAWSTPGAAVIVATGGGLTLQQGAGAFIATGLMVVVAGASGSFERAMARIPHGLASALLAGVLARFALDAFLGLDSQFVLVFSMLLAYLFGRRLWPRYAVPGVLVTGMLVALAQGQLQLAQINWRPVLPVFIAPEYSLAALFSVALPLFVVTMASQNMPGVAALRAAGYADAPVSTAVATTRCLVSLSMASILSCPVS